MDQDPHKNFWEDGNGSGSEKMDAWSHLATNSQTAEQFYTKARQPFIKSYNMDDAEPLDHPNGFHNLAQLDAEHVDYWQTLDMASKNSRDFFSAARRPDMEAGSRLDEEPTSLAQKDNKWYFHHLGKESKTESEFYEKASKPSLRSWNEVDAEPTYHSNGHTL